MGRPWLLPRPEPLSTSRAAPGPAGRGGGAERGQGAAPHAHAAGMDVKGGKRKAPDQSASCPGSQCPHPGSACWLSKYLVCF